MEYYHLHTLGIRDKEWKESREFIVRSDKFNNRLFYKMNDFSTSIPTDDFSKYANYYNYLLTSLGYAPQEGSMNIADLIDVFLKEDDKNIVEARKLLEQAKKILVRAQLYKRENALETFRLENCSDKPSRMHSLYLTTEDGVKFWKDRLIDNDMDVYMVEVDHEPFVSNEQCLPDERLSFGEMMSVAGNYWYPKLKKYDSTSNEYLYQGRVRILKKVDEIKKGK